MKTVSSNYSEIEPGISVYRPVGDLVGPENIRKGENTEKEIGVFEQEGIVTMKREAKKRFQKYTKPSLVLQRHVDAKGYTTNVCLHLALRY